ncbi:MAG: type II secretion system minor pseudopilin GspK [Candidatus Eremiobacteraeota bacterium]|nr:type II secretion system minor pseudopilin GspK [Candidatus Eremiobacteraeota bacterium]
MIIVTVLGVIGILLIMNLQLSSDTLYAQKYLARLQNREAGYYISLSAFRGAVKFLEFEQTNINDYDSLQDTWAQALPSLEVDEGKITIHIEDEERYFALNSLVQDNKLADEKHVEQFRRLLQIVNRQQSLSDAAVDWIDPDSNPTAPEGSELQGDTSEPCKNGFFDSVDELLLVKGFSDDVMRGEVKSGEYMPGLKDVLCPTHGGKVNINTAGVTVLQSLDKYMTREMADEIISRRTDKPFEKIEGLSEMPGFNTDTAFRIKSLADVKSSFFRVIIEVERAGDRTILTGLVNRMSDGGSKILYWKVE